MNGQPAHHASMIPPNMRGTPWRDQVPRQRAFMEAHPEVTITSGGAGSWWQAAVPDGATTEFLTRYELSDLLDILEERYAPP